MTEYWFFSWKKNVYILWGSWNVNLDRDTRLLGNPETHVKHSRPTNNRQRQPCPQLHCVTQHSKRRKDCIGIDALLQSYKCCVIWPALVCWCRAKYLSVFEYQFLFRLFLSTNLINFNFFSKHNQQDFEHSLHEYDIFKILDFRFRAIYIFEFLSVY